jgi:hypothetical protein
MAAFPEKLRLGMDALKQGRFAQAVQTLECCLQETDPGTKPYLQAQMHLVEAYQGNGQNEQAIALCQSLTTSDNPQVQQWAQQALRELPVPASAPPPQIPLGSPPPPPYQASAPSVAPSAPAVPPTAQKAGRAAAVGAKVALSGVAGNLALASGVTLSLLFGMVLVLCLALLLITNSSNPGFGLAIATTAAILFNAVVFFLSPFLMDLTQK